MGDIQHKAKKLEEGHAWQETDEVVEAKVKRPLDKVIPVRLPSEKWEELRRETRELGVGPATLARKWILEKLRRVMLTRASNISHDERTQKGRGEKSSDPRRRRRETEERRRAAREIAQLAVEAVPDPDALSHELDTTYELRDESGGST
ncbi:MAG: hypothetical protein Q8P22_09620 [Chloroflexota bacterium]|nr:hypothetical protein [Chloroflexota bacterium]